MINTGPKENANPIVHSIINEGQRTSKPVGWSQVERVFGPITSDTNSNGSLKASNCIQTLEDRAVMHALADSMENGVSILESVGISLQEFPHNNNSTFFHFTPHSLVMTMEEDSVLDDSAKDDIDREEIFSLIRCIQDPEHPLTLEQLRVVSREQIEINHLDSRTGDSAGLPTVEVRFTPTIPHCSMATLIGLCIRVKLLRSLPRRYKVAVKIQPHTHQSEIAINKQLADKERVSAALENKHLLGIVNRCILDGMTGNLQ